MGHRPMADPLSCKACRAWWELSRERILAMLDINTAVDRLMWDSIQSLGLSGLRQRSAVEEVPRREAIEYVLGRYHRNGHTLDEPEPETDDGE